MEQVSGQVKEIRKLVEVNQDTLLALHTNRDKPDVFNDLMKRVKSKWKKHMHNTCTCIYINTCTCIYMYMHIHDMYMYYTCTVAMCACDLCMH